MYKKNLFNIFAIFIVFLFLLQEVIVYLDFKKVEQNYSTYSLNNNISYEEARREVDNLLILSRMQSKNHVQIEKFLILNMISIGYVDKDIIVRNANIIMNVYKLQEKRL